MTQILVHRVPVQAMWSGQQQGEVIQAYAKLVCQDFPRERHIFLADDGSGRGGITVLDPRQRRKRGRRSRRHGL